MSKPSRWIRGIRPDAPLTRAARSVLRRRLAAVESALRELAAAKAPAEAERAVHQLRVATRRAGATVRAMGELLGRSEQKRVLSELKRLRRSAGPARDLDVQLALIDELAAGPMSRRADDLQILRKKLEPLRERLHQAALGAAEDGTQRIARASAEAVSSIRLRRKRDLPQPAQADGEPTFADAARHALAMLAGELRRSGEADLNGAESLHELRIAGKRLRYAIELFSECYGPPKSNPLRTRTYPVLEEMQERLGRVNDLHVLAQTARDHENRAARPIAPDLEALAEQEAAAFRRWWAGVGGADFLTRSLETAGPGPDSAEPHEDDSAGALARDRRTPRRRRHSAGIPVTPGQALPSANLSAASEPLRFAAIDVGTNSIRLVVAEAEPDGTYQLLDDEKETTRLGRGLATTGSMAPDAVERSALAIARMRAIAAGYRVQRLRIVGTCAVRDAANSAEFLSRVRELAGVEPEIISAREEAMLAFRSAANAFDLSGERPIVTDIGGGSTEIVSAEGSRATAFASAALGAVRLTERFGGAEASAGPRFAEMRRHIADTLAETVGRLEQPPTLMIGSGGTFTTLAEMAAADEAAPGESARSPARFQGDVVTRERVKALLDRVRRTPVHSRHRIPGLSADRADIIVAGLAIVAGVMRHIGVPSLRVHEQGIRDGLILEMIAEAMGEPAGTHHGLRDRMLVVRRWAKQCRYEHRHSEHVAALALQIFDQAGLYAPEPVRALLTPESRELLLAAAVLHDIGYIINYDKHHKHSYHMIANADLPGFTGHELEVVANVARYHRRSEPADDHPNLQGLDERTRLLIAVLSSILRVADGLDRPHSQSVREIRLGLDGGRLAIDVFAGEDPETEIWGAQRKAALLERVFGRPVRFAWAGSAIGARELTRAMREN